MGATSWHYFVGYQPDPERALQALRAEVFARGEFRTALGLDPEVAQRFARAFNAGSESSLDPRERELFGSLRNSVASAPWYLRPFVKRALVKDLLNGSVATKAPPDSIDAVVDQAGDAGTHSILDISHTGAQRTFAVAAPLPERGVEHYFGTPTPTRAIVDERSGDIANDLERWEAVYFPVWTEDDAEPAEWAFVGVSGD